jgi:hypothetical protein
MRIDYQSTEISAWDLAPRNRDDRDVKEFAAIRRD